MRISHGEKGDSLPPLSASGRRRGASGDRVSAGRSGRGRSPGAGGAHPVRAGADPETLRLMLAVIQDLPEVRGEKVGAIREAIRDSRYRVPGEEVAGRLLDRLISDGLRRGAVHP